MLSVTVKTSCWEDAAEDTGGVLGVRKELRGLRSKMQHKREIGIQMQISVALTHTLNQGF